LHIRIPLGLGLQAKIFETKIDTRIDLKPGSEGQNLTQNFYWIFGYT